MRTLELSDAVAAPRAWRCTPQEDDGLGRGAGRGPLPTDAQGWRGEARGAAGEAEEGRDEMGPGQEAQRPGRDGAGAGPSHGAEPGTGREGSVPAQGSARDRALGLTRGDRSPGGVGT